MSDKKKMVDDLPRRGFTEREFSLMVEAYCWGSQNSLFAAVVNNKTKVNRIYQDVKELHNKLIDQRNGYEPIDCVCKDIQIIIEDM